MAYLKSTANINMTDFHKIAKKVIHKISNHVNNVIS